MRLLKLSPNSRRSRKTRSAPLCPLLREATARYPRTSGGPLHPPTQGTGRTPSPAPALPAPHLGSATVRPSVPARASDSGPIKKLRNGPDRGERGAVMMGSWSPLLQLNKHVNVLPPGRGDLAGGPSGTQGEGSSRPCALAIASPIRPRPRHRRGEPGACRSRYFLRDFTGCPRGALPRLLSPRPPTATPPQNCQDEDAFPKGKRQRGKEI